MSLEYVVVVVDSDGVTSQKTAFFIVTAVRISSYTALTG
jgi:hypothetical protein